MDWAPQPAPVQPSLVKSRTGSWAAAGHSCWPIPRGGSWINTTEVRPRGPGEWACPAVWWGGGAEMVRACGVVMQGYAGSCLEAVRRTTLHTGVPTPAVRRVHQASRSRCPLGPGTQSAAWRTTQTHLRWASRGLRFPTWNRGRPSSASQG